MKNWHVVFLALVLSVFAMFSTQVSAQQPFCAVWPLTSDQTGSVSPSNVATTSDEVLHPGTNPALQIFDYWGGQGQRLKSAGTGSSWNASGEYPLRRLQFQVKAAVGFTLNVTDVSFDYGGNGTLNRITAAVRYANDPVNFALLTSALADYPAQSWTTFSHALPVATTITGAVPLHNTFTLWVLPYAITSQQSASPSFAAHRNVKICGTATPTTTTPASGPDLSVTKSCMVGSFTAALGQAFNVLCTVTATNNGTVATPVSFPLEDDVSGAPGNATFLGTSGNISCTPGTSWTPNTPLSCTTTNPGGLAANGGSNSYQFRFNLPTGGSFQNCATATVSGDTNSGNNQGCTNVSIPSTTPSGPDLSLTKSCIAGSLPQSLVCTFTVTNIGTAATTTAPTISDTMTGAPSDAQPINMSNNITCPAIDTGAGWIPNSPFTCGTSPNVIQPGASNTYTVRFRLPTGGTIHNCATVQVFPTDTTPANNTNCTDGTVPPPTPSTVSLSIHKDTGAVAMAGTFSFNIACTGSGGPYTGPNPISITLPGSGLYTAQVPQGDTCTITENQPTTGSWGTPIWSGLGVTGNGWSAQTGTLSANSSVNVTNLPAAPQLVRLIIRKSTGESVVAGTYLFNISCTGSGGPYTGTNPVSITLPGSGSTTTQVPQGDTCTVTEAQPTAGSWDPPSWTGNGITPAPSSGWSTQTGTIGAGGTLLVTNNPRQVEQAKLQIIKNTGDAVVAGTYNFNISCTGPGGPYTGPNPISITLSGGSYTSGPVTIPPSNSGVASTSVPQGDTCTVTEVQPSGLWNTPTWSGTGVTGNGWSAQVPITGSTAVMVTNSLKTVLLQIDKHFSSDIVSGQYTFTISCTGSIPYTGTLPITVPSTGIWGWYPPQGDTCTIQEQPPAGFNTPTWSGVNFSNGWGAQVGPLNANTVVTVTNQQGKKTEMVKLELVKRFSGTAVPGTYNFTVSCDNGTYTTPVIVTVLSGGTYGNSTFTVPQGGNCSITENNPPAGWNPPTWSASGVTPNPASGWSTSIGTVNNSGPTVTVTNNPKNKVKLVPLAIGKSFATSVVSGTYNFNITCSGPGGPYTGANPVSVTVPSPGFAIAQVPQGDTCMLSENQTSGWNAPSWAGNGVTTNPANGWSTQVGPVNASASIKVTNNPKKQELVKLQITKSTGDKVVAGTYIFNISCMGLGGPYTGQNPVSITLPGSGSIVAQVPQNDTCTLTEVQPTTGSWNTPTWTGVGVIGNGWSAQVSTTSSTTVKVTNKPKQQELVKLQIIKSTGDKVVAGTYTFNITCAGSGGPYTGTNPISITLPGSGNYTAQVPQGDTCTVTEVQPASGSWSTPTWSGTGVTGNGWSAQVPINNGATVHVTNNQKKAELVDLTIIKSTGHTVVPGTYYFNIACTGPGGPFSTIYPVQIVLPGTATYVAHVPAGDTCTVTEGQLDQTTWNTPTWSGIGVSGNGWSAQVPIVGSSVAVKVTNNKKK